jgi:hypothetical protein
MSTPDAYGYVSLTAAIDDKRSPLREYFDRTFPWRKALQEQYRLASGPVHVEAMTGVALGTLGAAFDFLVRMVLDPAHRPGVAYQGLLHYPGRLAVLREVNEMASDAASEARTAPAPETLLRAAWVFALCTELYRLGTIPPGSPLEAVWHEDRFTADNLMALAPTNCLEQLRDMHALAITNLYAHLPNPAAQVALGPTFSASSLCAADADMIVDGCLLEMKTRQGRADRKTGIRRDDLPATDLYQLLGYLLFDHGDKYRITSVGYYSARYGTLIRWPVQDFTSAMAGRPVDVTEERERVWLLLGGT